MIHPATAAERIEKTGVRHGDCLLSRQLFLFRFAFMVHRFSRSSALRLIALALLLIATGCASSGPGGALVPTDASEAEVERRLRAETERWHGTPHVWGGASRRGVDCSGLVQAFYSDLFGLNVPRTTEQQVRKGRRVRRSELQAGDLVFFRPSAKTRHVGLYLSGGAFAHASSSSGVTISQLDRRYWDRRYWTARRLLDLGTPRRSVLPAAAASAEGSSAEKPPVAQRPRPEPRPVRGAGW